MSNPLPEPNELQTEMDVADAMQTLYSVIPVEYDLDLARRRADAIAEEIKKKEEHLIRTWLKKHNLELETLQKNGWHLILRTQENGDRHYSLAREMQGANLIIHTDVKHSIV
jgi:hypothetical protein